MTEAFAYGLAFGLTFGGLAGLVVGSLAEDAFDFIKFWDKRR